jgi:hypothetical protein
VGKLLSQRSGKLGSTIWSFCFAAGRAARL